MKRMTFVLLMAMVAQVATAQSNGSPQTMTVCTETTQQTRGLFRIPTRDRNKQCQTTTVSGNMLGFGGGLGMAPVGVYAPRCPECVTSQTIAYMRDSQVRSEDAAAARIAELEAELARERARTSTSQATSRTASTQGTRVAPRATTATTTPVVPAVPAKTPAQIAAEEAERRRRAAEILREEAGGAQ